MKKVSTFKLVTILDNGRHAHGGGGSSSVHLNLRRQRAQA